MRDSLVYLPTAVQDVPKAVLSFALDPLKAQSLGVGENRTPRLLGFRQVAPEIQNVAMTNSAELKCLLITGRDCNLACGRVGHVGLIKFGLSTPHSSYAHPRRCEIGNLETLATDRDHRRERVFGLRQMALLFQVHRIGEQCGSERVDVLGPMRLASRAHDAAQMRRLRALTRELGAVALGRRPLIPEHVGSWRLAIG